MTITKARRGRPLADSVTGKLKSYIARRGLRPGDRLPTEHELAERFGVSRLGLREALRPLLHLGVLRTAPRRGLTVGQLDVERLGECLDFHALVASYPAQQLVRAREIIELGSLPEAIAAMRDDPALHDRLRAIVDAPGVVADADAYIAADIAFHRELMAATGIGPLVFFERLLEAFFRRFRDHAAGPGADARMNGVRHHRRILAALRDGRLEDAQAEVRKGFDHYRPRGGRTEGA
jgi:DNA-binding FadR family transcriptional regulator